MSNTANAAIVTLLQQATALVSTIADQGLRENTRIRLELTIAALQADKGPTRGSAVQGTARQPSAASVETFHQLWQDLHTTLNADAAWDAAFDARLKCRTCAAHWAKIKAENPPVYGAERFEWTVKVHNLLNAMLGKPQVTADAAQKVWEPRQKIA